MLETPKRDIETLSSMRNALENDIFNPIINAHVLRTASLGPTIKFLESTSGSNKKGTAANPPFQILIKHEGSRKARPRVVGIIHSKMWTSENLLKFHQEDNTASALMPLRQLALCAEKAKTPYGLIVTEKEVVIVRVSYANKTKDSFSVECRSVKWDTAGTDRLTAKLAIWGLIRMSLNDAYCRLLPEGCVVQPTKWESVDEVLRNSFSLRDGLLIISISVSPSPRLYESQALNPRR